LRGLSCLRGKPARAVLRGGDGGNTVSLLDYNWQDRKVRDIRAGRLYQTRFASPQGSLIPLTPQEFVVVHRAKRPRRQAPRLATMPQLLLFEVVPTG
jgi:hypothetical protein